MRRIAVRAAGAPRPKRRQLWNYEDVCDPYPPTVLASTAAEPDPHLPTPRPGALHPT